MHYLYKALIASTSLLATPFIILLSIQWSRTRLAPPNIPWAGLNNKRLFPKLRANLREITAKRDPLLEGYEKYSKHGQPFILPSLNWPDVVLPPSHIPWLISFPDNVLSTSSVFEDVLATKYLGHGPDLAAIVDFSVIRRDLTRHLNATLPDILDEVRASFDESIEPLLSSDEDWADVKIVEIILNTARRLSNRAFVGESLCRNKRFMSALKSWEFAIGICSAVIRYLVPQCLQPMLGPVIALPVRFQDWKLKRLVLPVLYERLAAQSGSDEKDVKPPPNDVLQWLLDAKLAGRDAAARMTLSEIAHKTVFLNFFAVHTTALNTSSTLHNILTSTQPPTPSLIQTLLTETAPLLPTLSQNPTTLRSQTPALDSVIRESLRFKPMNGRGLGREVVAPTGLTTPDGLYLPCGTHVCVVFGPRQLDEGVWERGGKFAPLRFYREGGDEGGTTEEKEDVGKAAVHITEDFMSFGLGRHACPGRFFAVQAMKIILATLITRYEFQPLEEPMPLLEMGEVSTPSEKATVKMRRRREEVLG
ncbi:cytochrome P450 [Neohortaea acidophila]|uniref:Cytochrome P450 n=1 Tax=Neohortaea acidophila TaxID=245834 RepID=A0A6A6PQQ4_9PEZI|nr:cytochrome P450 [Neohortaea acidophila]KAF2482021.1 cytochrome P450 [Neohortaea acidophila]